MVDILADQEKRAEKVKNGREVMYRIRSYFRITFGCQVGDYDGFNYRVKFSEGEKVVLKDIPRKYMEDHRSEKVHSDYWVKLFKTVEEELRNQKVDNPV